MSAGTPINDDDLHAMADRALPEDRAVVVFDHRY